MSKPKKDKKLSLFPLKFSDALKEILKIKPPKQEESTSNQDLDENADTSTDIK